MQNEFDLPADSAETTGGLLRPSYRLTALARETARAAAALIGERRDTFLSITWAGDDVLALHWWRDDMHCVAQLDATVDQFCPPQSVEGRLQRAGAALIAFLTGRWPREAIPREIGVITDGVGVAFSPEFPSPIAPGWHWRLAAGEAALCAVVPLDRAGPCALLRHDGRDAIIH